MRRSRHALVLVCVVAGLVGAATASASTGPSRVRVRTMIARHTALLPHSRFFGPASAIPHASGSGFVMVDISTRPVDVTINDITYRESLDIVEFRDPFGPPQVFIDLAMVRTGGSFQVHYYDYAPSNPVATTLARRTLAHASVDTGSAIAPDVLQVDYTATTAMSRTACRLQGGGTGYRRSTKGTITYGQFGIDTTTSPFFGVLASAGTQARLTLDPGCGFGGDPGHTLHQCTGHVELSGGTTDGSLGFAAADNYGRTHVFEAAGGGGGSDVKSIGHVGFETGPITNLPRPRWTATGAAAHLRTGAGVLMTGSATFTSHRAPVRSAVKRCLSYGRIHSFRVYRYLGRLTPDATPLAALFDTGTLTLPGTVPGALRVLVYSS